MKPIPYISDMDGDTASTVLNKQFSFDISTLGDTSSRAISSVLEQNRVKSDIILPDSGFLEVPKTFMQNMHSFYENCMYLIGLFKAFNKLNDEHFNELLEICTVIYEFRSQIPFLYPSREAAKERFGELSDEFLSIEMLRAEFDAFKKSVEVISRNINTMLVAKGVGEHLIIDGYETFKELEGMASNIQELRTKLMRLKFREKEVIDMNTLYDED